MTSVFSERHQAARRRSRRPTRRRRLSLEALECRELLSGQTPLISDAAPYNAAFVNAMFRDVLGHLPDAAALQWDTQILDEGVPAAMVAGSILGSDEHATDLVQATYRQYLGRDADPAAIAFWANALPTNARDEQLIGSLVSSDEFYLRASGNNSAWVAAAYQAVLNRPASASDLTGVSIQLDAGMPRSVVAYNLATSMEHERQVVAAEYSQYLRATPDDGSLNRWANQLASGQTIDESVAANLMSMSAYYQAQTGVPLSTVPVPVAGPAWNTVNLQIDSNAAQGNAQVVFLGDSITQLWMMQEGAPVWAHDYASLGALNAGIAGDRTQNLLWRIENGNLNGISPQVAVVMIGTNNILLGDDVPTVIAGIQAVVEELHLRLPNTKILLMGLLPAAPPVPINVMQMANAVNQSISALADGQSVFYLDVGAYFINADGTINQVLYQPMLIHPNTNGYAVLAGAIAPELDDLLA